MIVAVIIWGLAITAFGFSHILGVSMVLLAVAGWADVISAVLRNTILQTVVPEHFRSRIVSIQLAVVHKRTSVVDADKLGNMGLGIGNADQRAERKIRTSSC